MSTAITTETPNASPVGPWTPLPAYQEEAEKNDAEAIYGTDHSEFTSFNFRSADQFIITVWFLRSEFQIKIARRDLPGIDSAHLSVNSGETIVGIKNPRVYVLELIPSANNEYLLANLPDKYVHFHFLVGLCLGRVTLTTE